MTLETLTPAGLFTDADNAAALERMRDKAACAYRDSQSWTGPLSVQGIQRMTLFCEAAADLSGRTVEQELATARGEAPEPAWAQGPHH